MSKNKMLIDATHPEETRVVVLKDGRIEEFDYESAARKLLRGNIYLAKVTRVEPSLQAAFVDYGGNRHGFLAFNEIHPDYYQIPMADRQALLEQEALAAAEDAAEDDNDDTLIEDGVESDGADGDTDAIDASADDDSEDATVEAAQFGDVDSDEATDAIGEDEDEGSRHDTAALAVQSADDDAVRTAAVSEDQAEPESDDGEPALESSENDESSESSYAAMSNDAGGGDSTSDGQAADDDGEPVEQVGADDALDDVRPRARRRPRSYKIQEVIKRRQVILVQVVKEERGNKGAALTTYLSLAGRYTVLMPNTARGGGISRKITNPQDRKRLKSIANDLDVPEGMGLIIRTAGASRTKQEIRRDFEYLLRLWESVRDLTLKSQAPCLVYEEGNLIKRSIRDLYNKDVDEVSVAGNVAYKEAKDFMRMLMPSHAKHVVQHADPESLFTKHGIERQLNAMFSPQVTLRSGGYLIINQTEALVAVDVNSGKSTREFSIEETALATNLEAADEIARQLRLRDLAGLVVIDFIDMDEKRNNRAVERRLKEALRHDRARIQLGRISHFGLMEMSRQRLRTGVLEGSTSQCPHCQGTGIIRSTESVALAVLRAIEDTAQGGGTDPIVCTTAVDVAIYILNHKRPFINEIEHRQSIAISVEASDKMQGANFTVARVTGGDEASGSAERTVINMDWGFDTPAPAEPAPRSRRSRGGRSEEQDAQQGEGTSKRRRRRRGGRRGDKRRDETNGDGNEEAASAADPDEGQNNSSDDSDANGDGQNARSDNTQDQANGEERRPRRRRRGRRGGRRERERRSSEPGSENQGDDGQPNGENDSVTSASNADASPSQPEQPESDRSVASADSEQSSDRAARETASFGDRQSRHEKPARETEPEKEPTGLRRSQPSQDGTPSEPKLERIVVDPQKGEPEVAAIDGEGRDTEKSGRRGWWQRRLGGG
jgi:ribonuclease E